jgi:hypothetical protein
MALDDEIDGKACGGTLENRVSERLAKLAARNPKTSRSNGLSI